MLLAGFIMSKDGQETNTLRQQFKKLVKTSCLSVILTASVTYSLPATADSTEISQISFDDNLVDAAEQGNLNAVTSLVRSGKFVDSRGKFGTTALMRSVFNKNDQILDELLSSGASPNLVDVGGASALHIAARKGNIHAVEKLLTAGANPNLQDKEGWTPLMRAALYKQNDVVKALLNGGANPNLSNMMKETALQHAVFAGDASAVNMLVEHGADIKHRDENGLTPADIAFQRGFSDIQKILADTPVKQAKSEPVEIQSPPATMTTSQSDSVAATPKPLASADNAPASTDSGEHSVLDDYTESGQPKAKGGFSFTPLPSLSDDKGNDDNQQQTSAPAAASTDLATETPQAAEPDGTHYLLQLGTFGTRRDARERWNALQSANTDLLGGLQPIISEVTLRTDERTVYRTQAGYFPTRKAADSLCEKLFSRSIDCFVVENAGEVTKQQEPPRPLANVENKAQNEPLSVDQILGSPPQSSPPSQTEKTQTPADEKPWKVVKAESDNDAASQKPENSAPAKSNSTYVPPPTKTLDVNSKPADLAMLPERSTFSSDVPPSDTSTTQNTPPEKLQQMAGGIDVNSLPSNPAAASSWLQISGFANSYTASDFWQNMQSTIAEAKDLRFRTVEPLQARGGGQTSMRIGPINSENLRKSLCEYATDNNHDCRVINEFSSDDGSLTISTPRTPSFTTAYNGSASNNGGSAYWVMLGSFQSQPDAAQRWQQLLASNSDILRRFQPDISEPRYSSSNVQILRLRVGPFMERQSAANMCADLQGRGVRCLTLRD